MTDYSEKLQALRARLLQPMADDERVSIMNEIGRILVGMTAAMSSPMPTTDNTASPPPATLPATATTDVDEKKETTAAVAAPTPVDDTTSIVDGTEEQGLAKLAQVQKELAVLVESAAAYKAEQESKIALLEADSARLQAEVDALEKKVAAHVAEKAEKEKEAQEMTALYRVDLKPLDSTRTVLYAHFVDKEAADDFVARATAADSMIRRGQDKPYVQFQVSTTTVLHKGQTPTWK